MKVSKKTGKIKLEPNEFRYGNFVLRRETEHMVITDIGSRVSFRVTRDFALGKLLELVYGQVENGGSTRALENYTAMIYLLASSVPDQKFIEDVCKLCQECMKRHPEVYGESGGEPTDAEHEEAALAVKEMKGFEEEVKKLDEKGGE